ncbi:MAG: site-specific DNA-methyltransferase [Prevotella sp.]|nr:site-specific DNA-methyltransferase [Prevotella sp.]MBR6190926.1 site-specific DNA-methyltransferase [Prevotella sp.]
MIRNIAEENEKVTLVSREMEGLREYFPQCFNSNGEFDIEKFREAIQPQVDVTREGRSYDFLGKSYARMLSSLDTTTVIRPDVEHNSKPENQNSENIYISGDNLDALHHLVKSYAGQVKCIYIDPPYNTGTDGFVYNDKFKFTAEELENKLSISSDEAEKIIAMTSGHRASHAAWLTFMMPRLQLARDLMSKDGVIFISIDDNEQAYLKQLCDNIFGEDNFVAQLIWEKAFAPKNDAKYFSDSHDYILVYARNIENFSIGLLPRTDEANARYKNPDNDPKGPWTPDNMTVKTYSASYDYPITTPNGTIMNPPNGRCWFTSKEKMQELINEGRVWFGENGGNMPRLKRYLSDVQQGMTPITIMKYTEVGHNQEGRQELKQLFGGDGVFDGPKPVRLLKRLMTLANLDNNSFVVDFFGGSSSTADAIMQINAKEGKSIRYCMVQWQEKCKEGSTAYKAGYRTIDEIGMERIKRAAKKIKEENPLFAGDLGFKHYTLEEVPQNTLDKLETFDPNVILSTDDALNMFGRDTVLATWLVNDGYGLGAKTEEIVLDKYHATLCGNHLYMTDADFDEEDMAALVDRYQSDPAFNPDCIVLFGYSFSHNAKDMLEKNKPTINLVKDKNIIIDVRY